MHRDVIGLLHKFKDDNKILSSGRLSMILVLSRKAFTNALPLDFKKLKTGGGGQIAGASGEAVRKILKNYKIQKKLSSEGGRTSRGSIKYAQDYINLLNVLCKKGLLGKTNAQKKKTLKEIESYWIQQVRLFFGGQRIKIPLDFSLSISEIVSIVLAEARERQKRMAGSMIEGAVLQHLIGAKLSIIFGDNIVIHHSASTADAPTARASDFTIGKSAIHVTTAPTEALIRKCKQNIQAGMRPIIVCPKDKIFTAQGMAENASLHGRIEIYAAQEFISTNLNEKAKFEPIQLEQTTHSYVQKYNDIVSKHETDQSLQLEEK
jgi:hypothetical protein